MQQQDNHEYPFLYQRQTCHQVQPNQATYQKRQKCQPATYLQEVLYQLRSEERFSRNAETDLVCRLLLEKKNERRHALRVYALLESGIGVVGILVLFAVPAVAHLCLTTLGRG